jgi:DNA-binding NarL/FixJ family response regulator
VSDLSLPNLTVWLRELSTGLWLTSDPLERLDLLKKFRVLLDLTDQLIGRELPPGWVPPTTANNSAIFIQDHDAPLRLLVADDDESIRVLVRSLLESKPGWQVCGEATNGVEAVEKVGELNPDVVLLDLSMPIMNGFQAAAKIRRISPSTKIVFFSIDDIGVIAREVGADAFVSKFSATEDLFATIERATGHGEAPEPQNPIKEPGRSVGQFKRDPRRRQTSALPSETTNSNRDTPPSVT